MEIYRVETRSIYTKQKSSPVNLLEGGALAQGLNRAIRNVYGIYSPSLDVESISVALIIALISGCDLVTADVTALFLKMHISDDEFLCI